MRIQVSMTLPREAVSVPLARRVVATALSSAGVDPSCVADVEVALSEACTNVFRHAGSGEDYEVLIQLGDEQLTVDVVDSGSGFGAAPTKQADALTDAHAEGGRGIALMRALTDEARFDRVTGDGGSVHLVKRLRWSPDSVRDDLHPHATPARDAG